MVGMNERAYKAISVISKQYLYHLKGVYWDFSDSPVVKTSPSNTGGAGSIPGWGPKIPHAFRPKNQDIKQ